MGLEDFTMAETSNIPEPGRRPLQKMFTDVPTGYDLMNRILTLRLDEKWRKKAARECARSPAGTILDLCTGTGDLALHIAKRLNGQASISGLDYSRPMLEIARRKASRSGYDRISFMEGDAAAIPFGDGELDTIGIAFAFRNLTYKNPDRDKFLSEIFRTLSPDGKFVIVETSQPGNRILKRFFHAYLKLAVARLGGWMSGHSGAYRYLSASAINFYHPDELAQMLGEAGFTGITHRALLGGVAAITVARKQGLADVQ